MFPWSNFHIHRHPQFKRDGLIQADLDLHYLQAQIDGRVVGFDPSLPGIVGNLADLTLAGDYGWLSVIMDPTGAVIAMWKPKEGA
jgi:hypothetical protein